MRNFTCAFGVAFKAALGCVSILSLSGAATGAGVASTAVPAETATEVVMADAGEAFH